MSDLRIILSGGTRLADEYFVVTNWLRQIEGTAILEFLSEPTSVGGKLLIGKRVQPDGMHLAMLFEAPVDDPGTLRSLHRAPTAFYLGSHLALHALAAVPQGWAPLTYRLGE